MNTTFWLKFKLLSDATFGRGDGVAGLVDVEVQHDEYGLPFLGGRALKGMLRDACNDILYSLKLQGKDSSWYGSANNLFGNAGSSDSNQALLHIGDSKLPEDLRTAVEIEVKRGNLIREQVLGSLTSIRHQTAIDITTGAPKNETLRSIRVILRDTPFESRLLFSKPPSDRDLALLAACIKAFRRAGTGRNRGKGEISALLYDESDSNVTESLFARFQQEVLK
ncbi:MAG: RAMP superfamily CRISPR-associated protein [Methanothrix sp.]|jgi:CRISPR/Cas system CSM-associated protein Csm3 (group 7 of RAMP superfamily)|nr:RAMP superfamily CRISPR-associated protein [Methanothrix sp.]